MSVNVIDTIKPKNGGSFPVVEAVDVAVSGTTKLPEALAAKANVSDIANINTQLAGKANTSDLAALSTAIAGKADNSDISELRTEIALKAAQSSLDATNVVVASKAAQSSLDALSVVVSGKADKADYTAIYDELDTKASFNDLNNAVTGVEREMEQADANLQNQIDQIEISASAESVVAPEVAAARVDAEGTSHDTLKARIDYTESNIRANIEQCNTYDLSLSDKRTETESRLGITYTYNATENKYSVAGTSTGLSFSNILLFQNDDVPSYIKQNEINYIHFRTGNSDVKVNIYIKKSGDADFSQYAYINSGDTGAVYLPENLVGLLIRLEVPSGKTVDTNVELGVVDAMTNEMLSMISMKSNETVLPSCDLNDLNGNNIYLLGSDKTYTHAPLESGMLITYELAANFKMQVMMNLNIHGIYKRTKSPSQGWSVWLNVDSAPENGLGDSTDKSITQKYLTDNSSSFAKNATQYTTTDPETGDILLALADITSPGYYVLDGSWVLTDAPTGANVNSVYVEKFSTASGNHFIKQTIESVTLGYWSRNSYYRFSDYAGTFQAWTPCGRRGFMFSHPEALPTNSDLNDVEGDSLWLMGGEYSYINAPYYDSTGSSTGILIQSIVSGWKFQLWVGFGTAAMYRRFGRENGTVWRAWERISGGSGGESIVYNVTQNINRDEFTNTYNITTNPSITTDSNGWLQPVDTESADDTSKTDMSGAILSMLNSTGYCHLAPGIFYVSGIDMPNGATLEGCGKKTIIRLLSSVESGYTVRLRQRNTVKNLTLSGGYDSPADLITIDTDLGSRHGIYVVANSDGQSASAPDTLTHIISGCFFENFDGSAVYMRNTGGGDDRGVLMSDSIITFSKVGINIDYYSEYSRFTNILIRSTNHACINNGGNNVFVNCAFAGVVGFVIDNSGEDKRNNAHGSCVGCTFNHIDYMHDQAHLGNGNAVFVKNSQNGFIFNDCQMFYGNIRVENSAGMSFNGCLLGGNPPTVTVIGSTPAFFNGCTFMQQPTINVNASTKMNNCYLASTGAPIINQ